jgi:hypothetical protein
VKNTAAAHKKPGGWHWRLRLMPKIWLTVERGSMAYPGEAIVVTGIRRGPQMTLVRYRSYKRK